MLRGTTRGAETTTPETSSRLIAGAISMINEEVGTAVPAAEQIAFGFVFIVHRLSLAEHLLTRPDAALWQGMQVGGKRGGLRLGMGEVDTPRGPGG